MIPGGLALIGSIAGLGASYVVSASAPATTMKAGALVKRPVDVAIHLEDIQEIDAPVPLPGIGQVLVKVEGSSVNPVDWKLISAASQTWSIPHIFGRDLAGTAVAVGPGVTRIKAGDIVWADNSSPEGAHAEYVVVDETFLGIAPASIPPLEAGVLPLVSLTNLAAFKFAGLGPQSSLPSIVILGGSGGCGHAAIQMAKGFGVPQVVATCGTEHIDLCRELGADIVIDYSKQQWQDVVGSRTVDFVYDAVGLKGTGDLAYDTLKDGGHFATVLPSGVASDSTARMRPSVKQLAVGGWPKDYTQLDILRTLADGGHLRPHIDRTFTIAELAKAFNASMAGHIAGKISIVPSSAAVVVV